MKTNGKKGGTRSPLTAHLGYWLRFVSNQVSHAFAAKLSARDIAVAEWVILRQMYDQDPVSPSILADQLGLTRGAVSKLAERLIIKALVTRTPGKEDRRYQTLALTPKGRDLVPALCELADRNDDEFFGHLNPAEKETIKKFMQEIVRHHDLRTVPVN